MAEGNRHLRYKAALNEVEAGSPGAKAAFYLGFLREAAHRFDDAGPDAADLRPCTSCGAPTTTDLCSFCRLKSRVAQHVESPRRRVGAAR